MQPWCILLLRHLLRAFGPTVGCRNQLPHHAFSIDANVRAKSVGNNAAIDDSTTDGPRRYMEALGCFCHREELDLVSHVGLQDNRSRSEQLDVPCFSYARIRANIATAKVAALGRRHRIRVQRARAMSWLSDGLYADCSVLVGGSLYPVENSIGAPVSGSAVENT